MSDKKFDKILQQKLKGHQVKLGGPTWADMEKMLNESEQTQSLDREVRNRLQNHTVEYKESHWQILKSKLELEKNLKEKIYLSKVAEFSILALLLFSVFHFNQQNAFDSLKRSAAKQFVSKNAVLAKQKTPSQSNINFGTQSEQNLNSETSTIHKKVTVSDATSTVQSEVENSNQQTKIISTIEPKATGIIDQKEESIDANTHTEHSTFGPISPAQNTKSKDGSSEIDNVKDSESNQDAAHLRSTVFVDQNENSRSLLTSHLIANLSIPSAFIENKINPITGTSINMFSKAPKLMLDRRTENEQAIASHILINSMDIAHSLPMADLDFSSLPKENERWIGAMTGVDINLIRRPIDPDKIDSPQNFAVVSLTTGANYSTKKGRNEFFTGIGYSEKFYDPLLSELIKISDSFYNRDYTLEKYDIIHLPAHYKRHLGDSHKLHAYAFGGVSMNFVIYTDYEQQDNLRRGQPRSKQNIDIRASYDDTGDKGLLEGGYYKDNIYFTADAGIGLEKQFNRIKLFVESQYKRNLFSSQLGPRKVKLSSLSFNIGTKYKI